MPNSGCDGPSRVYVQSAGCIALLDARRAGLVLVARRATTRGDGPAYLWSYVLVIHTDSYIYHPTTSPKSPTPRQSSNHAPAVLTPAVHAP